MPINSVIIEANNLDFAYGANMVLDNLNFQIKEGDYVGIIGPNGGGKTTLVKILLGLLKPTKGKIRINNMSVGYVPQRVSQTYFQFPVSVREIVATGSTKEESVNKAMVAAGIENYKNKLLSQLSGGQRQRVFIARALAGNPKILILDEPTVGVDIPSSTKFYEFLRDLNQKQGITILFVTHDVEVIAKEVSSVLCLNKTLVCHGLPKDFIQPEFLEKLYGDKVKFVIHNHNV